MKFFLGWRKETWESIRDIEDRLPEEEIHERECDCDECRLNEYFRNLTEFERLCWNWYHENINPFTLDTGLVGEAVKELNLERIEKKLFLTASNMIYQHYGAIRDEMIQKEMDKKRRK